MAITLQIPRTIYLGGPFQEVEVVAGEIVEPGMVVEPAAVAGEYDAHDDAGGHEQTAFAVKNSADNRGTVLLHSTDEDYADGEQVRDFVYVKDAVAMTLFFFDNPHLGGLYNIGTGEARTWNDLVIAVFVAMGKKPNIEYIDMPDSIRNQYQYFTQADISKLRSSGYDEQVTPLEDAIKDYVQNYLQEEGYLTGI